uniref:Uncharacterized protein n=1 Tax=Arundo donax TaxID=35708 RepID=A0A0A9CU06_ARUDO
MSLLYEITSGTTFFSNIMLHTVEAPLTFPSLQRSLINFEQEKLSTIFPSLAVLRKSI